MWCTLDKKSKYTFNLMCLLRFPYVSWIIVNICHVSFFCAFFIHLIRKWKLTDTTLIAMGIHFTCPSFLHLATSSCPPYYKQLNILWEFLQLEGHFFNLMSYHLNPQQIVVKNIILTKHIWSPLAIKGLLLETNKKPDNIYCGLSTFQGSVPVHRVVLCFKRKTQTEGVT